MKNNLNDKILSPKNDYLFKRIFFDDSDKNIILKKLLQDCIGFDDKVVEDIILLDRTDDGENINDKTVVFDLNVKLNDGSLVNVEIQRSKQRHYAERSAFYTARRLANQKIKGEDYSKLKDTVSLNILDFKMFDNNDFYNRYKLVNVETQEPLTDIIKIDFLELPKLNEMNFNKHPKRALWVDFFNAQTKGELEMILEKDKTFEPITMKLVKLSSDPSVLSQYELEERRELDRKSMINTALEEGIAQGIEQGIAKGIAKGIAQGKLEVYESLVNLNLENDKIQDILKVNDNEFENVKSLYQKKLQENHEESNMIEQYEEDFNMDM